MEWEGTEAWVIHIRWDPSLGLNPIRLAESKGSSFDRIKQHLWPHARCGGCQLHECTVPLRSFEQKLLSRWKDNRNPCSQATMPTWTQAREIQNGRGIRHLSIHRPTLEEKKERNTPGHMRPLASNAAQLSSPFSALVRLRPGPNRLMYMCGSERRWCGCSFPSTWDGTCRFGDCRWMKGWSIDGESKLGYGKSEREGV